MPLLLAAAEHGYFAFSVDLGAAGVGRGALRVGLSACLFLVPTALMGATFPLMVVGLARQGPTFGRWLGDIYAFNTLGGVMGAVGAGFALIPALGLMRTNWVAAGLNVAVGLVALVVARRLPLQGDFVAPTPARPSDVPSAALRRAALTCATLSGLAALGYEVVWARALVFIVGNSTFAFTTMLAAFLVGIGLGGAVGGRLADAVRRPELPLALVETTAGHPGVGDATAHLALRRWGSTLDTAGGRLGQWPRRLGAAECCSDARAVPTPGHGVSTHRGACRAD